MRKIPIFVRPVVNDNKPKDVWPYRKNGLKPKMAIRIIKKINASTRITAKRKPAAPEKIVENWVADFRSKKLKEREQAEKFWKIGQFAD